MTGLLRRKRFNARGRRGRLLASLMTLSVLATAGLAAPAGSLARTSGAKPLIEGGETPAEGTYGYVGRVIGNAPEGEFLCSSSLIAPQWVLTAGHCVGPANGGAVYAASDFKVTLGAVNWKKGTAYGVSEVFRNPGYLLNWKPEDLVRDDSGLLRLSTPSSVTPIALISAARFASEIKDGTIVSAAGWGLTTPNAEEFTETLKVVHGLKVLEENEAESEGNKVLIGTEAAKGTCPGDSGGPFIDSRGEEIASTSAGPSNECNHTQAQSIPAVYGWIRETIGPDVTSSPASTDAAVGDSVTFTVACAAHYNQRMTQMMQGSSPFVRRFEVETALCDPIVKLAANSGYNLVRRAANEVDTVGEVLAPGAEIPVLTGTEVDQQVSGLAEVREGQGVLADRLGFRLRDPFEDRRY